MWLRKWMASNIDSSQPPLNHLSPRPDTALLNNISASLFFQFKMSFICMTMAWHLCIIQQNHPVIVSYRETLFALWEMIGMMKHKVGEWSIIKMKKSFGSHSTGPTHKSNSYARINQVFPWRQILCLEANHQLKKQQSFLQVTDVIKKCHLQDDKYTLQSNYLEYFIISYLEKWFRNMGNDLPFY